MTIDLIKLLQFIKERDLFRFFYKDPTLDPVTNLASQHCTLDKLTSN